MVSMAEIYPLQVLLEGLDLSPDFWAKRLLPRGIRCSWSPLAYGSCSRRTHGASAPAKVVDHGGVPDGMWRTRMRVEGRASSRHGFPPFLASAFFAGVVGCGDARQPQGEISSPAFRVASLADLPPRIEIGRKTQRLEPPVAPKVILLGPTHQLHFSRSDFQEQIPLEGTAFEPLRIALAECTGDIRLPMDWVAEGVAWGLLLSGRGLVVRECDGRSFDELQVVQWLQPYFGDGTELRLASGEVVMSRIEGLY